MISGSIKGKRDKVNKKGRNLAHKTVRSKFGRKFRNLKVKSRSKDKKEKSFNDIPFELVGYILDYVDEPHTVRPICKLWCELEENRLKGLADHVKEINPDRLKYVLEDRTLDIENSFPGSLKLILEFIRDQNVFLLGDERWDHSSFEPFCPRKFIQEAKQKEFELTTIDLQKEIKEYEISKEKFIEKLINEDGVDREEAKARASNMDFIYKPEVGTSLEERRASQFTNFSFHLPRDSALYESLWVRNSSETCVERVRLSRSMLNRKWRENPSTANFNFSRTDFKKIISTWRYEQLPSQIFSYPLLGSLILRRTNLESLPKEVGQLKNLKKLDITYNNLTTLPNSISKLQRLKILFLGSNNLCSLPESIGFLKELEELDSSNNSLISLPDSIGDLESLKILNLNRNQLSSFPDSIGKLKELEELNMNYNNLTSLPSSIGNLESLSRIEVYKNQLKSIPDSILERQISMKQSFIIFSDIDIFELIKAKYNIDMIKLIKESYEKDLG